MLLSLGVAKLLLPLLLSQVFLLPAGLLASSSSLLQSLLVVTLRCRCTAAWLLHIL